MKSLSATDLILSMILWIAPQKLNLVTEHWAGHICKSEPVPPHTMPLKSVTRLEHMLASTEQKKNSKTISNFFNLKWDFCTGWQLTFSYKPLWKRRRQIFVHNPVQEQIETTLMKDDYTSKCKEATYILKNKSALIFPCPVYPPYLSWNIHIEPSLWR